MTTLQTERLVLLPWRESDAEALYEYAKNPNIGPAAGWPPHKDVEDSLGVIRNVFNGPEDYAIVLVSAPDTATKPSRFSVASKRSSAFRSGQPVSAASVPTIVRRE